MQASIQNPVTVAKRQFVFGRDDVERAMAGQSPEPIASHYVVIGERRFPPKQVIIALTGLDRADFTTHHARRILKGLGFAVGRLDEGRLDDETRARARERRTRHREDLASAGAGGARALGRPSAQELEPFIGKWVATRGPHVLIAADHPSTVVDWLAEHAQQADSMFRVPETEQQASGLAPL